MSSHVHPIGTSARTRSRLSSAQLQVVNPSVRRAKVLDASCFMTNFSLAEHGVLEAIGRIVSTSPVIVTARLNKVSCPVTPRVE